MERDVLLSRFRPWINAAAVAAVFAAIAALALACPPEDLLFTHLAAGDRILAERAAPRSEEFSYTAYSLPWTDVAWGYQAGLAALRRTAGLPAVGALHALAWIGLFAWLFAVAGRGAGTAARAAIVLLAGAAGGPWLRPGGEVVAGWLLIAALALLGAALETEAARAAEAVAERAGERAAARRRRVLLWGALPALVAAGANLNERFALVLAATLLFAVDRFLAGMLPWARGRDDASPALAAAIDAFVGLALQAGAALLNPYGARALRAMFETALDPLGGLPILRSLSDDVRPVLSGGLPVPVAVALAALAGAAFLLLVRHGGARMFEASFLLLLGVLALRTRRDLPPFLLAAAFFALRRLARRPGTLPAGASAPGLPTAASEPEWPAAASLPLLAAGACVAASGWILFGAVRPAEWPPRTRPIPAFLSQPDDEPEGAARFVAGSGLPGQVFHSRTIGGYLLDAWGRDRRIFVDARLQPFQHGVLRTYVEAIDDPEAFERAAAKYQITAVVWPHRDAAAAAPLLRHLASPGRWKLAALDAAASVWVRADALSPEVVKEMLLPGPTLSRAPSEILAGLAARPRRGPPVREAALGEFFAAAGDPAGAEIFFRRAVEAAPRFAALWMRLGDALEARGDRDGALHAYRTAAGLDRGAGSADAALGRLALEAGNLDEADRWLAAAARAGDDRPSTLAARARLAGRRGRDSEARRLFADALRDGPDRDILVASARFEGERGALEPALELYARARARRPDDPVVAAEAAALLEAAGRFDEALEVARGPAEGARSRSVASGAPTGEDRRLLEVAARVARRSGEPARAEEWEKAIGAAGGKAPEAAPATPGR